MKLSEFTLGTTAPRLNVFKGISRTADDIIRFDCDASFVPKDDEDLQVGKDERNSRIVLSTRIGRGLVAVEVPLLVRHCYLTNLSFCTHRMALLLR